MLLSNQPLSSLAEHDLPSSQLHTLGMTYKQFHTLQVSAYDFPLLKGRLAVRSSDPSDTVYAPQSAPQVVYT